MCLPIAAAAGTAAAFSNTMAVAGLAISAISTGIGMAQASQQAAAAQQQAAIQTQQAQQQANFERQQIQSKHIGDVRAQQAATNSYVRQVFNNDTAANKVYMQEQAVMQEANARAAFKSQEIYAKQIGAVGSVLSTGMTGQSVGLLAMDAERQAGFAQAQSDASTRSAGIMSGIRADVAFNKAESANNEAASRVPAPVSAPQYSPWPLGIGGKGDPGVPSYNWGIT
jgi:disulfide bond formation protein DsbB